MHYHTSYELQLPGYYVKRYETCTSLPGRVRINCPWTYCEGLLLYRNLCAGLRVVLYRKIRNKKPRGPIFSEETGTKNPYTLITKEKPTCYCLIVTIVLLGSMCTAWPVSYGLFRENMRVLFSFRGVGFSRLMAFISKKTSRESCQCIFRYEKNRKVSVLIHSQRC